MQQHQSPVILLTGVPGVGKTTAIQRFLALLQQRQHGAARLPRPLEVRGFVTREMRGGGGRREGFEAVLCSSGRAVILAHESRVAREIPAGGGQPTGGRLPQVSKYVVDVPGFESEVLPQLALPSSNEDDEPTSPSSVVYVIDEIGKMECFSALFKRRVTDLLDWYHRHSSSSENAGRRVCFIVGTIVLKSQDRLVEAIKARKDVRLLEVTHRNRDAIPQQMLAMLLEDAEEEPGRH